MTPKDILMLDSMLTPKLIQLVYWLFMLLSILAGISILNMGFGSLSLGRLVGGIVVAAGGLVISRVACELMLVLFSINDTLHDIRENTKDRPV